MEYGHFQEYNAASEQPHFDAIGTLIERYQLSDPALSAGVFTNPDLQELYDKLLAKGDGLKPASLSKKQTSTT